MTDTSLILPQHRFSEDFERFERTQYITDEFLDDCKDKRIGSQNGRMGELHQFAQIPTVVVDQWMREGFNIFEESAPSIVKRLKEHSLGAFLTTTRNI